MEHLAYMHHAYLTTMCIYIWLCMSICMLYMNTTPKAEKLGCSASFSAICSWVHCAENRKTSAVWFTTVCGSTMLMKRTPLHSTVSAACARPLEPITFVNRTAVPCSIAVVLWKRNTPGSAIFFDPVWSVWQCCNTCCTWLNWDMYRLNMAGTWANGGLRGQQRDSSTKRRKAKEIWRLLWLMFKDHDTLNHRSFLWFLSGVAIRSPKLRKPHCCRACWCQFTCCCRDALQVYFGSWANVSAVTTCKPWQSCGCSPSFKDNNPTCSSLKFVLPPLPKHGSYGHWPRSVHGRRCREKTHRAWTTVNHSKSIQSSIYREEHYCFARVTKSMLVSLRARTCKTSYHPHTSIKKTQ